MHTRVTDLDQIFSPAGAQRLAVRTHTYFSVRRTHDGGHRDAQVVRGLKEGRQIHLRDKIVSVDEHDVFAARVVESNVAGGAHGLSLGLQEAKSVGRVVNHQPLN